MKAWPSVWGAVRAIHVIAMHWSCSVVCLVLCIKCGLLCTPPQIDHMRGSYGLKHMWYKELVYTVPLVKVCNMTFSCCRLLARQLVSIRHMRLVLLICTTMSPSPWYGRLCLVGNMYYMLLWKGVYLKYTYPMLRNLCL